ncbi:hypothetical protein VII00023_06412 [Vibrio ichthyoenteri ATCC 700023]|uniref:Uncharacterized protein n=1 Tax=Vibrio ichthyoenteri ATCC 700023 TaxID=870968 RepID=F9S1S4_9VIBR|nr:hypothetical protein VII00023_06412 [Vibrio ichthyoenteri ATCC 700023]
MLCSLVISTSIVLRLNERGSHKDQGKRNAISINIFYLFHGYREIIEVQILLEIKTQMNPLVMTQCIKN